MKINRKSEGIRGILLLQVIIISFTYSAAAIFGFIEAEFFNTYLGHVLYLNVAIFVPIMVNLSAIVGLISNLILGILSDNTRSRFGRRRPFLLIGGVIAGSFMFLFAFSQNFIIAVIIDVIIIGIASNAYYIAQRTFIPDLVDIRRRGRANGIAWIFFMFGMIFSLVLFLILNEFYSYTIDDKTIIYQEGYILALGIGGFFTLIVSIIGFVFIKEKKGSELPPKKPFLKEFKDIFNLKELKKNKEFYKLLIALTIFSSGVQVVQPYLFIYIFELGFPTTDILIILGVGIPIILTVIYILGFLADKYGRKKFITPTILIACVGFFMLPILSLIETPTIFMYIIAFALILINIFAILTPLNAFSQDLLPEDKRGKFMGILNIMGTVSQNIGVTTGGIIIGIMGGTVWAFAFAPIFFIISIPLFMKVKETLPKKNESSS
ncbi:MAG: MFS transporter [Candidatus Helarchaeota archaeon]